MIARPERNKDVLRDFNKVLPLVHDGCLLEWRAFSAEDAAQSGAD